VCVAVCRLGLVFWRVYKSFSSSGQNDPSLRAVFSEGDTTLDYHFTLLKINETVSELINPEVGPAGVEGDELGLATSSAATTRGKRKRMPNPEFQVLIYCSASMAASAAKHARMAELVALSTTLKNAPRCPSPGRAHRNDKGAI